MEVIDYDEKCVLTAKRKLGVEVVFLLLGETGVMQMKCTGLI
jgi:hypothetical protein